MSLRNSALVLVWLAALAAGIILAGCGSNSGSKSGSLTASGTVITTMSDPGTCQATTPAIGSGFRHVFVTVTDVKAHTNANAGDNDAGFVDLTPNLKNAPVQVDLLGSASAQCFLSQFGSGTPVPPGNYQQIRIILASNTTAVANNQCTLIGGGTATNCVQLATSGSPIAALLLSSEDTTGIKIPSGQIAGGGLNVPAGQTANLNLDFNACASIVQQPDGTFRLKPVVHAGAITATAAAISGKIVDSRTTAPIPSGNIIVALEQKDSQNVDRVLMETSVDNTGTFNLCPVAAGTYDVVAVAISGNPAVQYAASVITGVQPGSQLGNVPLVAQVSPPGTQPATITAQVTTAGASGGVAAEVVVSALQPVSVAGSQVLFTIPLAQQSATSQTVVTQATACAAGVDCGNYTLVVPAENPNVAAFSSGTPITFPTPNLSLPVPYTVDGQAIVLNSPATPDCAAGIETSLSNVTPGATFTAATMNFTGCQ